MNVITEPDVYLVGKQVINFASDEGGGLTQFKIDEECDSWQSDTVNSGEYLAEVAGRLCYMSFNTPRPGGNAAYLEHIKESKHGSVTEHAVFSFIFTGVSRSLTHELVRHRTMSYSQLSQRYVDESVAEYVCPDVIRDDPELYNIWQSSVEASHAAYVKLVEKLNTKLAATLPPDVDRTTRRKSARQAARSVLPNATETKIFVTMNVRSARNFLEQRGSRHADPEIRKLANRVLNIMQIESPNLFGDYQRTPLPDGTFEITTPYPKV
jgi:thymidylate synthase (FAD)